MENTYENLAFWRTYAELYWPDLNFSSSATEAESLGQFSTGIARKLNKSHSDKPLNILLLGSGFGGVELPVLYHLKDYLKKKHNRSLCCIFIDRAETPLRLAAHILKEGFDGLPRSADQLLGRFAGFEDAAHDAQNLINDASNWQKVPYPQQTIKALTPRGGDAFYFFQDDLNWEPNAFPQAPSAWLKRLDCCFQQRQQFDLIFAAFSFFHIDWWRSVAMDALSRLNPNGLFLHAKVEGDEGLFEGRIGCHGSKNNNIAKKIFLDGFFSHPEVAEEVAKSPRANSASQPLAIESLLAKLTDFGLSETSNTVAANGYTVTPRVGAQTYGRLLKTRGFSTFRNIASQLDEGHPGKYDSICDEAIANVAEKSELDVLQIHFRWNIYQLHNPQLFQAFPLRHRFQRIRKPTIAESSASALHDSYVTAYELSNPLRLHKRIEDEFELAKALGRRLNVQGLLHDQCLAFELGLWPKQGRTSWSYAANALCHDAEIVGRTLEEVATYLALLDRRSEVMHRNFSNTKALLEAILPMFNKAPVLIYDLERADYSLRHTTKLDYEEFRFTIPRLGVTEQQAWGTELAHIRSWLQTTVFARARDESSEEPDDPADVLTSSRLAGDAANTCAGGALKRLFGLIADSPERLESICSRLIASFSASSDLPEDDKRQILDALTPPMAFTLRCLKLMSEAKQIVFYPARYELEQGGFGKDVIICVYSRCLSEKEVTAEYHKFDQFFDEIKMHRLELSSRSGGVEETIQAFSHEIAHQTSRLFGTRWQELGKVFDLNGGESMGSRKGVNDWPKSAGSLTVAPKDIGCVSKWLVCPTPNILHSAKSLLYLWSGSPSWAAELNLKNEDDAKTIVKKVWDVALGAAVAVDIKNRPMPKSVKAALDYDNLQTCKLIGACSNPTITIRGEPSFSWIVADQTTANSELLSKAQSLFVRAFVAASLNTIVHAGAMQQAPAIEVCVVCSETEIVYSLSNSCTSGDTKNSHDDGTKAVLSLCVRQMGGDVSKVKHFCDTDERWVTEFSLPRIAVLRGQPVQWLSSL